MAKVTGLVDDRAKRELEDRYSKKMVARAEWAAEAVLRSGTKYGGKLTDKFRNELVHKYGKDAVKLGETMAKAATGDMDALVDLDDQATVMLYKQARVQLATKYGEDQIVKAESALEAIQVAMNGNHHGNEISTASRLMWRQSTASLQWP